MSFHVPFAAVARSITASAVAFFGSVLAAVPLAATSLDPVQIGAWIQNVGTWVTALVAIGIFAWSTVANAARKNREAEAEAKRKIMEAEAEAKRKLLAAEAEANRKRIHDDAMAKLALEREMMAERRKMDDEYKDTFHSQIETMTGKLAEMEGNQLKIRKTLHDVTGMLNAANLRNEELEKHAGFLKSMLDETLSQLADARHRLGEPPPVILTGLLGDVPHAAVTVTVPPSVVSAADPAPASVPPLSTTPGGIGGAP